MIAIHVAEKLLQCIDCGNEELELALTESEQQASLPNGEIRCGNCGSTYTIQNGIIDALREDPQFSKLDQRNADVFRETWKRFPDGYAETDYSEEMNIVSDWPELAHARTILDAGCGMGRLMPVWQRSENALVVFVDISDALIQAQQVYLESYSEDFDAIFIRANLKKLPLKDKAVEIAWSNGVIHHTDKQDAALADILRVTEKDCMLGIISEKTLIGKVHIWANAIKPLVNRISNFHVLYWLTGVVTAFAYVGIKAMCFLGLHKVTRSAFSLEKCAQDEQAFAKLKFCLFDVMIAPTYTKHPDSFYVACAKERGYRLVTQTTSSMFEYFEFARE